MRTIKPEIWDSRDFQSLSILGRLLFIACFSLADDYGRLATDPGHLRRKAAPGATLAVVEEQLNRMVQRRMIQLYRVKEAQYLHVVAFMEHQRPERPSSSSCPEPPPLDPIQNGLEFGDDSPNVHRSLALPARAEIGDVPSRPVTSRDVTTSRARTREDEDRVFTAWQGSLPAGTRVSFTSERRAKVHSRLEHYPVDDLEAAVSTGWQNDALRWPERAQPSAYELTVLLRSDAQAEKFINLARLGPAPTLSPSAVQSAQWREFASRLEAGGEDTKPA